jgi:hypothetical protein
MAYERFFTKIDTKRCMQGRDTGESSSFTRQEMSAQSVASLGCSKRYMQVFLAAKATEFEQFLVSDHYRGM